MWSFFVFVKASFIFCSSYRIKLSVTFYLTKKDFEINKQYRYDNDIQKSEIISYKLNNLAKRNTVNNSINVLINREENHLNIDESYLEIEFMVSGNGGGLIANDASVRLVNYGVMALFISIKLETIVGKNNRIFRSLSC